MLLNLLPTSKMPKHYRSAGKEGKAAKYITRSKAVKRLQVSLSTFRKLCILKGIVPREPKKKIEGNHRTYYHKKDILSLQHDPLLEKFRVPPPHLSPFVDNEAEGSVPEYAETMKRLPAVAGYRVSQISTIFVWDSDNPQNLFAEGVIDRAEANEIAEKKRKLKESDKQYQDELKMDVQGMTYSSSLSNKNLPTSTDVARHGEVPTVDLEQVAKDATNLSEVSMPHEPIMEYWSGPRMITPRKKSKTNRSKERERLERKAKAKAEANKGT